VGRPANDRLARLAAERRGFDAAPNGPLSVCLVYPNTYPVAMANLGFQAVYRLLARDPRVTVDRAYLPDGPRAEWPRTLRSFEQDRPLASFDVVAFSISFETDYLHVLDCLALAGLPLRRTARRPDAPLVLAGGPATFLNPSRSRRPSISSSSARRGDAAGVARARRRRGAAWPRRVRRAGDGVAGAYRPDRYTPRYDADGPSRRGRLRRPRRRSRRPRATSRGSTRSRRGRRSFRRKPSSATCSSSRRAAGASGAAASAPPGFMYRPVRYRSARRAPPEIERGLAERATIGLVGAEMASQPDVAALCRRSRARAAARRRPR
jgi:hypothetical protein